MHFGVIFVFRKKGLFDGVKLNFNVGNLRVWEIIHNFAAESYKYD